MSVSSRRRLTLVVVLAIAIVVAGVGASLFVGGDADRSAVEEAIVTPATSTTLADRVDSSTVEAATSPTQGAAGSTVAGDRRPASDLVVIDADSYAKDDSDFPPEVTPGESTTTTTTAVPVPPPTRTPAATLHPGGVVRIVGSGFRPGATVRLELHSEPVLLEELPAEGDGSIDTVVQIPGDAPPGEHDLVLIGPAPDGESRTITIPIDLIVQMAGRVTKLSGTIINSRGEGVRQVLISSTRIDGSSSAQGQTNEDGTFSVDVPTGINTVRFSWGGWVDSGWRQQLSLPREWSLDVASVDFAEPTEWNIQLPATVQLTVELPNNEAGFVGFDAAFPSRWNVETDPISSEIAIADSVIGAVRMGYDEGYAPAGVGAIFDIFPLTSAARIFKMSGGGDNAGVGLNNVDVSSTRTIRLVPCEAPVQIWFLLSDSNSEITSVSATRNSDQNIRTVPGPTIWIDGGVSFDIDVEGTTDGVQWHETFTNQSFLHEWNKTLRIPSHRQVTTFETTVVVPGGASVDASTIATDATVLFRPDAYLGEESTDTAIEGLLPGFTCIREVPIRCTASQSGTTSTFAIPNLGPKFDQITFTGKFTLTNGVIVRASESFENDDFVPGATFDVSLAPTVDPSLVPTSGSISGQLINSIGGVGRTRILYRLASGATSPTNGFDSEADGSFSLPVAINPDQIVIQGESNIDPSRGVPTNWTLVVPTHSFDLGVFTLPDVSTTSIQVLGPLGFPIPGVRIAEERSDSPSQTLLSSTGVTGYLYNGHCPDFYRYICLMNTTPSSATTDQNGIAHLVRFDLQTLGRLHLWIPASGPNAAAELVVDAASLSGGTAKIIVPDRK